MADVLLKEIVRALKDIAAELKKIRKLKEKEQGQEESEG